jgi:ATP-dependent Clp protease ATP-binding subunit ClpC
LEELTINLSENARQGLYSPIIGRANEMAQLNQVLLKRIKKNAILVGDAGVGKTAIVEELSRQIVEDKDIHHEIQDYEVVQLDLSSVLAGTSARGELEERVKNVLTQIENDEEKEKRYILFIDEIHSLIQSSNESQGRSEIKGEINISDLLKESLARGRIQCIGATTRDEYVKYFQNDPAFDRRFQYVEVPEPSKHTTLDMMKSIKKVYEDFHKCTITETALEFSVNLAEKYIPYRNFPDKSIDLIDEACSKVVMNSYKNKNENNHNDNDNLEVETDEEIFKKISESRVVDEKIILEIISSMNDIDMTDILETTATKLNKLETTLSTNIIGQDKVVDRVMNTLRRYTCGLHSTKRPVCSMLFLGPTGVGKTEISKLISNHYYGRSNKMIRLDMSEYMDEFSVSSLIGAPPGYLGYSEGGKLTNAIKRNPCSLVLFDEIEKAHPVVLNLLLQILEDGILTDGQNKTYSFRNAMIVMTSNAGYGSKENNNTLGFVNEIPDDETQLKDKMNELTNYFRPEFVNRIDDIVLFNALDVEAIQHIIDLTIEKALTRVDDSIHITITDEVKDEILKNVLNEIEYGARPVNRLVENLVMDRICDCILRCPDIRDITI